MTFHSLYFLAVSFGSSSSWLIIAKSCSLHFNVLFKVLILCSFSFIDGFLHRFTKDFLSSFLVEGRRSPRGDRLACSNDLYSFSISSSSDDFISSLSVILDPEALSGTVRWS